MKKEQSQHTNLRPYEKCLAYGAQALTDAELLAVIIRSGASGISAVHLAEQILKLNRQDRGLLGIHHLSMSELKELRGIGEVKAIQIKCIGELSKRIARTAARERLTFDEPASVADYYMEFLRHEEQEQMICMMLDTKNHLLGEEKLSKGTVNTSAISPRELFLAALSYRAVSILMVHNHPSGDATPSREDILLTQRVKLAGEMLGIYLLDHIVIGDCTYCSMKQEGLL